MFIRYTKNIKDASAIGIIGSSDGPTSIFISKEINPIVVGLVILGGALAIILIVLAIRKKKKK